MEKKKIGRPKMPPRKELRIQFTPEHFDRLEKVADKLDQTASALVRHWAMEQVARFEAIASQTSTGDFMKILGDLVNKMEDKPT